MASGLALAGVSGYLATVTLGAGGSGQPRAGTTTIDVATGPAGPTGPRGEQGAAGPTGPAGPPGSGAPCPSGYSEGALRINHPNGHVTIWTCILDEP